MNNPFFVLIVVVVGNYLEDQGNRQRNVKLNIEKGLHSWLKCSNKQNKMLRDSLRYFKC